MNKMHSIAVHCRFIPNAWRVARSCRMSKGPGEPRGLELTCFGSTWARVQAEVLILDLIRWWSVMVKNGSGNNGNRLGSNDLQWFLWEAAEATYVWELVGNACSRVSFAEEVTILAPKNCAMAVEAIVTRDWYPPVCVFFIIAVVKCNICIEEAIFFSRGSCEGTAGLDHTQPLSTRSTKLLQDCSLLAIWHVWVRTVKISHMSGFKSLKVKIARTKEASNGGIQPHMSIVGQVGHT